MRNLRWFAFEAILLMCFIEFKLRVYCYVRVTDVINIGDVDVINEEISSIGC